ncbi:UDP-glycosyltransferase UGT5-like [Aricia agestis]|uniref:UDP-glycosyltransferase UGT5-like n=1 Tax=Aricia agestis TaxID=91739 RepID=UPI001C20301E|nr:UDP-glycosyltransferase UGT5-like [Aricia agestis]
MLQDVVRWGCFLVCMAACVESANILFVIPFSAKSHYISLSPIGLELARRGHNVTVITAIAEKNPPPNYHQVMADSPEIWDVLGTEKPNIFTMADMTASEFQDKILWTGGLAMTEVALKSKPVQEFLKQDNKFDLVISEQFYQEALNVLAYKYNAPLALVTTIGNCMRHNLLVGNPLQLATIIGEHLQIRHPSSFTGRLYNMYHVVRDYLDWKYSFLPKQEALVKKYFPELSEAPSLYDIQRNTSLLLINSHFSYDTTAAYLPNIVEIGGIHVTNQSLSGISPDLKKILDESNHGFIYVNFGSNVKSSELPIEKKNTFLKIFKNLKQTVLWKWEDDNLENKPENVVIRKWLPQKDILAHPNIKVFVSHGGLIGTHEVIYYGVPVVGVPIYGDQYYNIVLLEEAGAGKLLMYHDINEKTLGDTLNEVIHDDSYRRNMKELSRRFKDRPMSPIDTAIWWLEYVIRNQGAGYMKNPGRELSWIALYMIDVYVVLAVSMVGIVVAITKVVKLMRSPKSVKKNKKQKAT